MCFKQEKDRPPQDKPCLVQVLMHLEIFPFAYSLLALHQDFTCNVTWAKFIYSRMLHSENPIQSLWLTVQFIFTNNFARQMQRYMNVTEG